jgi:putative transcriptional regulator
MANKKAAKLGSLTRTILSTARDMYAGGVMSKRAHQKITLRHLGGAAQPAAKPLTGKQIRALRDRENISRPCLRTTFM